MKTLVIGYGNTLRGDDGVGPRVAEQLEPLTGEQMRSLSVHQLTPELAAEMAQAEEVWFVDAWIGGANPAVQTLTMVSAIPAMDHGWRPETLLHLAKTLYNAEPTAYHLLIPAQQFDYGETLSAIAQNGVEWAVQVIKAAVEERGACHA